MTSAVSSASEHKCYEPAKKAAFDFVYDGQEIVTLEDFSKEYDNEEVEVILKENAQQERWSFYNTSSVIYVEVDFLQNNCAVKLVESYQNDQDQE